MPQIRMQILCTYQYWYHEKINTKDIGYFKNILLYKQLQKFYYMLIMKLINHYMKGAEKSEYIFLKYLHFEMECLSAQKMFPIYKNNTTI